MSNRAIFRATISAFFGFLFVVSACGRSGIDDLVGGDDAGPAPTGDAIAPAPCNASHCAQGCCDASGLCELGKAVTACGTAGQACRDCVAAGFSSCDGATQACSTTMRQCSAANCSGCCAGNVCFMGSDLNLCGSRGQTCQNCAGAGLACAGQQCVPPAACGAATCRGCCAGQLCVPGNISTACGQGGGQCATCPPGDACFSVGGSGGSCRPPQCNPANCPLGCCDAFGVCEMGGANTQCGGSGGRCQNCAQTGGQCSNRQCVFGPQACNARTCPTGCCDAAGICQNGFSGFACGTGGNACTNCSSFGDQCVNRQCVPTAPLCNAKTCPGGCCDANGTCQIGIANGQCGNFGNACTNCLSFGDQCANRQCVPPPPSCNAMTCPFGCCDAVGKCQGGVVDPQCGNFGNSCQDCLASGEQCSGQRCAFLPDAGTCDAQTCPSGCCDANGQCQQGLTASQCGGFGASCQNCLQVGETCAGQQCIPQVTDGGPVCNAQTCPSGCCDATGNCLGGFDTVTCGNFGNRCIDCMALGSQCQNQACVTPDGGSLCSQTCVGCCDGTGQCQGGFVNAQCGELGRACEDCTALTPASTCDTSVSPRTCSSRQMQCPAAYPGCPPGLQQRGPTRQRVCSTSQLQNAAAACSAGASSTACGAFFSFESSTNPACASCLQPFDVDFVEQSGVRACVAPFVDAACNHNSACVVDCTTQSCFGCVDSASTSQCETEVQSGTCTTFTQADQCVTQALRGPAAVCSPSTYQGNFGAWLQAVGAAYCGP